MEKHIRCCIFTLRGTTCGGGDQWKEKEIPIKELFFEYYKEFNKHNKPKKSKIKEKFSNNDEEYYDVKPIVDDNIDKDKTIDQDNKKKTIEPFKEEVIKLKELYENIKTEIKKLK